MHMQVTMGVFLDNFKGGNADDFSSEAKVALFNYLTEYEEDTGEDLEFAPFEWAEYFTEFTYGELLDLYETGYFEECFDLEDCAKTLEEDETVIRVYKLGLDGKEHLHSLILEGHF